MKNVKNFSTLMLMVMFTLTISITSCKKDDDGPTPDPIAPTGSTLKTNVAGKVTNTDGDIMQGVTVTLAGKTTVTDYRGLYLFKNIDVPKDRMVLKAIQTGYFDCIKGKKTQTGGVNYVDMVLQELPAAVSINATSGGTVNIPGGARIVFQANSFIDQNGNPYTGTVKVYARHFNPAAPGFAAIVPGGDLIGKNILGENVALYPMGMIEALLRDQSGVNEIKIASGSTAQLRMPIDPSQNAMAQSTIPLWHLNETTGIWKEEGEAVKNGNFFEGEVSHFSVWNCDYQGPRATITGKVVDCQNIPVAGIVVTINNFLNLTTNNAGEYSTWVPIGYNITAQVLIVFNNGVLTSNSSPQSILASSSQINTIPDLTIQCAGRIAGTIKNCFIGENVPAFISVSWGMQGVQYYSTDGTFSFRVPENTNLNIVAHNNQNSGYLNITSGPQGSITNALQVLLCDTMNQYAAGFTVNTGGIIEEYLFQATSSGFSINTVSGKFQIVLEGHVQPGSLPTQINITFPQNQSLFTFSLLNQINHISIELTDGPNTRFFTSGFQGSTTSNTLGILDYSFIGGLMKGYYEFDSFGGVIITDGYFEVLRTQ